MGVAPSRLTVVRGDIARLDRPVDVLVSSDDNYLSHGGGVSAAMWRAAGHELRSDPTVVDLQEKRATRGLMPAAGDVVVTGPGSLAAKHLVHAITIDFDRGVRLGGRDMSTLYGRCLDTALDVGAKSIALPVLGSGAAGGDVATSVGSLVTALRRRRFDPRGLEVVLVVWGDVLPESLGPASAANDDQGPYFDRAASLARTLGAEVRAAFERVRREWDAEAGSPPGVEAPLLLVDAVDEAYRRRRRPRPEPLVAAVEDRHRLVRGSPTQLPRGAAAGRSFVRHVVVCVLQSAEGRSPRGLPRDQSGGLGIDSLFVAPRSRLELPPEDDLDADLDHQTTLEWPESPLPVDSLGDDPGGRPREGAPLDLDPGSSVSGTPGTSAARRLRDLLVQALPSDVLGQVDQALAAEGYQGQPRERLLEMCARRNPGTVVRELFRSTEWPDIARLLGVENPAGDSDLLVEQILGGLGFPPGEGTDTVAALSRASRDLARRSHDHGTADLYAAVVTMAKRIERLLRLQLRFVTTVGFGIPAEEWTRERGLVRDVVAFDRAGMGTIVSFLRRADRDLQESDSLQAGELRRVARPGSLCPAPLGRIVELRNAAVHPRLDTDERAVAEARAMVQEFCSLVDELVACWESSDGGFPSQALVESITFDRWGRRLVTVSVDDERLTVFTDHQLDPGSVYLMKHFTNPWSIDPLVAPRGTVPEVEDTEDPPA